MAEADAAGTWCLIESDPGVFTEMIQKFGVKGVQFEEIYSLSKELLEPLNPVYGLIFLFKWVKDDKPQGSVVKDSRADEIFFPKQVVNNACATQAIISCLLNVDKPEVELGSTLENFRDFTCSFDPAMKGLSLGSSQEIREVHNSFARQSVFELDQKMADKDDDVFHFVTFVPIKGRIYELDGLKEGPVDHGRVPEGTDWLDVVIPVLMERMAKYQAGEIQFNLMAVIQDKITTFKKQLEVAQTAGDPTSIADIRMRIAGEEENRKRWKQENTRRRHNYLPFIVELLKFLAAENQLTSVYEKAKEKSLALQKKKEERKAALAASETPLK